MEVCTTTIILSAIEATIVGYLAHLSAYDIRHHRVTNRSVLLFLPILLTKCTIEVYNGELIDIIPMLIGAASGFAILLISAMLTNGGIGGGDIKLAAVLGLASGMYGTLILLGIASIGAAIFGAIYRKLKKENTLRLPFVPFMAVGYAVTLLLNLK